MFSHGFPPHINTNVLGVTATAEYPLRSIKIVYFNIVIYRMDDDQYVTISVEELRNLRQQAALVPQLQAQAALVPQLQARIINLENERRVKVLARRVGMKSCAAEYANTRHLYSMR